MIRLSNICFSYDKDLVVDNLSFNVPSGEILSIVGPSGCGKSTLLLLIAGLLRPQSGEVAISKDERESLAALRFLFQDYDAFPWQTTWGNVKYSASKGSYPSNREVKEMLTGVGLLDSQEKYPGELSGGMRKRLALARCLVTKPAVLLLDEPFSKLDVDTRYDMYSLLQKLWLSLHQTIVLVTHDLHEAILLGSRILVATSLPFRVRTFIEVPFEYPRNDSLEGSPEYVEISTTLRDALRLGELRSVR